MLPNLSQLSLKAAPTAGTLEDAMVGRNCGICFGPLNADSTTYPWDGPEFWLRQACTNDPGHFFHAGCLRNMVQINRSATCPDCRAPLLRTVVALAGPAPAPPDDDLLPYGGGIVRMDNNGPNAPPPSRMPSMEPPPAPRPARRTRRRRERDESDRDRMPPLRRPGDNMEAMERNDDDMVFVGNVNDPPGTSIYSREPSPIQEDEVLTMPVGQYAAAVDSALAQINAWINRFSGFNLSTVPGLPEVYHDLIPRTNGVYISVNSVMQRYPRMGTYPVPGDSIHDQWEIAIGVVYALYLLWEDAYRQHVYYAGHLRTQTLDMLNLIRGRFRALLMALLPWEMNPGSGNSRLLTNYAYETDPVTGVLLNGTLGRALTIRRNP